MFKEFTASKRKIAILIGLALAAILLLVLFFKPLGPLARKIFGGNDWYAVHLSNGYVYFGKIQSVTPETVTLKETHYLEVYNPVSQSQQVSQSQSFRVEQSQSQQPIYNLVRRGGEGTLKSDNVLFINRSAVLFWEKLARDADIVKNIESAKAAAR